jgi:hypothetical protein
MAAAAAADGERDANECDDPSYSEDAALLSSPCEALLASVDVATSCSS